MPKFYLCAGLILAAAISGPAGAEQITLSTYYPAPYGVHNDLDVTGRLYLRPIHPAAPTDPNFIRSGEEQKGMLITDAADNRIKRWDGSAWMAFAGASGNFALMDSDLSIYWGGNADVPRGMKATAVMAKAVGEHVFLRALDNGLIAPVPVLPGETPPAPISLYDETQWSGWWDFGVPESGSQVEGISVNLWTAGSASSPVAVTILLTARVSSGDIYWRLRTRRSDEASQVHNEALDGEFYWEDSWRRLPRSLDFP